MKAIADVWIFVCERQQSILLKASKSLTAAFAKEKDDETGDQYQAEEDREH